MLSSLISRFIILVFGNLYPAYASFKAVKNKNVRDYSRWMMYWIVFAGFTALETFADIIISWLPLYYEFKVLFVIWLLAPAFRGASVLYRRFLHPYLCEHEEEIDQLIDRTKAVGSNALITFGRSSIDVASNTLAKKGALWRSLSTNYLDQLNQGAPEYINSSGDDSSPRLARKLHHKQASVPSPLSAIPDGDSSGESDPGTLIRRGRQSQYTQRSSRKIDDRLRKFKYAPGTTIEKPKPSRSHRYQRQAASVDDVGGAYHKN